jgi:signal transduction histidine kinase
MSLCLDKFGVLWAGTFTGGVSIYRKWKEKFSPHQSQPNQSGKFNDPYVRALTVGKDGTVWIGGTSTGLWRYERQSQTYKNYLLSDDSTNFISNSVRSIMEDDSGLLWIGTDQGLFFFQPKQERLVRAWEVVPNMPASLRSSVWPIHQDPFTPSVWIGSPSILVEYRTDTKIFIEHQYNIGNGNIYSCTSDSSGNLWLGFYDHGLAKFDTKNNHIIKRYLHIEGDNSSLSNNRVWSLHTDSQGRIWIGTDGGGLDKLNEDGRTFSHYTMHDGLPSNVIFGILEDSHNNLWLSTGNGMAKFSPETKSFRNYTVADGLTSKEFNGHSSAMSSNGEMFFGGVNGFTSFFPDNVKDDPSPPRIVLTGFKKFDSLVTFSQPLSDITKIELDYEENIFTFDFAAIHFTDPTRNQHAYMLEGFDKNWIYCGTRKSATYTNLNPGKYVFHVKGSNCDGVWNEEGISIALIIHPPFWLTWWFLSLSGVIVVSSIVGAARYVSVRKIKRKLELLEQQHALEKERLRISKDMHDDLGARITEISLVTQLARKDAENTKAMEGHLQNISISAEEIITAFDEIVWAVNPENDTLNNLADYISQFTVEFLQKANIKARLDIPMDIPELQLSTEVRHNVFMVVKESLNNIVKYSGASEVRVRFMFEESSIHCSIEDNGKGFDKQEISTFSNGLKNMRKRIEELNGTFEMNSEKGKGTKLKFNVPLKS